MGNLMDLKKAHPKLTFEILYATSNNFLGVPVYSRPLCYLHPDAVAAIAHVEKEAESLDLKLKVFDGYRPLSIQKIMWDKVRDERYVSNPAVSKGRHTLGIPTEWWHFDLRGWKDDVKSPALDISFDALL